MHGLAGNTRDLGAHWQLSLNLRLTHEALDRHRELLISGVERSCQRSGEGAPRPTGFGSSGSCRWAAAVCCGRLHQPTLPAGFHLP
jgi:hypothetical protein